MENVVPLIVDRNQVPPVWSGKNSVHISGVDTASLPQNEKITIALVNNMPDAALEDTELQFFELLNNASGATRVHITLYSLPGVPRSDRGRQHLCSFYLDIDDLLNREFDAVIVTGTEPLQSDLRAEPYWPVLIRVLDWAEENTVSTVLSCLAAHAAVLNGDGIPRHPLPDKQFGVFDYRKKTDNRLTKQIVDFIHTPHSRWNEVREDALTECGYDVLTSSAQHGVNSFVKKKRDSLFVHFQGHPEYGTQTLLKEYRRDIKRYLRHERETYPSLPQGYFDTSITALLGDFRATLLADRREEQIANFPEAAVLPTLRNTWSRWATELYRNWFQYLLSAKDGRPVFMAVTRKTF